MLDDDDLNATDRDIIRLLEVGRCTPRYLAAELDLQQPYVSQRLRRLVEHDRVRRVDRGLYELATGENIHVPEDLADELYSMKGRQATYVDLLRELVETSSDSARSAPDPAAGGDTTTIDVETPSTTAATGTETQGEGVPDVDPDRIDGLDVPDVNHLYDELAGQDDLLTHRVAAILDMFTHLRQEGSADTAALKDLVDPDVVDYEDDTSVWSNMVAGHDTLKSLPGVEKPQHGKSTWKHTGDE